MTWCHRIRGVVLLVSAFLASQAPAEACFCGPACAVGAESSVFEATVTAIGPSREPGMMHQSVASLADVVVIRGAAPAALVRTTSSCDYEFRVGVRYRIEGAAFDASARGARAGRVWASQCGATRPIWSWDLRALPVVASWWWRRGSCGGATHGA